MRYGGRKGQNVVGSEKGEEKKEKTTHESLKLVTDDLHGKVRLSISTSARSHRGMMPVEVRVV